MVFIFSIVAALLSVVTPYLLGLITTSLFDSFKNKISINYDYIMKVIILLIILSILFSIASYIKSYIAAKISQKLSYNLRSDLIEKIQKIEFKKIEKYKKGDILSRITNDIESINNFFTEAIPELFYHGVYMIGVIIMMIYIDIKLSLIAFISIPLVFFILSLIIKKAQKYFELNQKTLGEVNSIVEESITNNNIIKSFNTEKHFNKKFKKINTDLKEYNYKSSLYSGVAMPVINFVNNLNYAIIIGIGAYFVIKGVIKIGEVQAFTKYMNEFSRPLAMLGEILGSLQSTAASTNRVFNILNKREEKDGDIHTINTPNEIIFKNVDFSYKKDTKVLNKLNFSIEKGKQTAIVGKTGSGKTTIISLLMNYYSVDKGEILFDNININDIEKETLRNKISMVLQDTWVFRGTIKDNITLNKNTTKEELDDVLEKSYVKHIINSLPNGINFEINEETNNLSEGEKQLITIARALLSNPKILILDEATSNVDSRIEYVIHKSMKNLMKNRTSIVIAHRLSTIINSDKIIVLDKGKIIETGTHKELLNKKGYYYKLYNSGNL